MLNGSTLSSGKEVDDEIQNFVETRFSRGLSRRLGWFRLTNRDRCCYWHDLDSSTADDFVASQSIDHSKRFVSTEEEDGRRRRRANHPLSGFARDKSLSLSLRSRTALTLEMHNVTGRLTELVEQASEFASQEVGKLSIRME